MRDCSLTQEDRKSNNRTWLAANSLSPHKVPIENSLPEYALNLLSRLVAAEEFYTKRRSCMRIFVRMDISVFQREGKFHYMVNELTRSHQTGLFMHWDRMGHMDSLILDLANVLHFVAYNDRVKRIAPRPSS
jgi:hypothetical protein